MRAAERLPCGLAIGACVGDSYACSSRKACCLAIAARRALARVDRKCARRHDPIRGRRCAFRATAAWRDGFRRSHRLDGARVHNWGVALQWVFLFGMVPADRRRFARPLTDALKGWRPSWADSREGSGAVRYGGCSWRRKSALPIVLLRATASCSAASAIAGGGFWVRSAQRAHAETESAQWNAARFDAWFTAADRNAFARCPRGGLRRSKTARRCQAEFEIDAIVISKRNRPKVEQGTFAGGRVHWKRPTEFSTLRVPHRTRGRVFTKTRIAWRPAGVVVNGRRGEEISAGEDPDWEHNRARPGRHADAEVVGNRRNVRQRADSAAKLRRFYVSLLQSARQG